MGAVCSTQSVPPFLAETRCGREAAGVAMAAARERVAGRRGVWPPYRAAAVASSARFRAIGSERGSGRRLHSGEARRRKSISATLDDRAMSVRAVIFDVYKTVL